MYIASQRFYRVKYEWNKVLNITGSAAVMFVIFRLLHLEPLDSIGILLKVLLLVAFGIALKLLKVIDASEIAEVRKIVQRLFTSSDNSKSEEKSS
jgi:hypothetical protein